MELNENSGKNKSHKNNRSPSSNRPRGPVYDNKPGLEARLAASRLLAAVIDRKTSLDGMMDGDHGNPAYTALSEADRGLVRAILNTSLRFLPRIEAMLGILLDTPLPDGARALHHSLIIAAAQMLYLDVPDHSAVDLAVEQANRDPRNRRFAKVVNAVLRRLGREKQALLDETADVVCMPGWFYDRLVSVYGADEARRIADAQMTPAAIDLTTKSDAAQWAERLNGVVLPTGSVRLASFAGGVAALDGFEEGQWWVQDAAAALPVQMFGDLAGKRAVDLCAAPGGKTAQLLCAGAKVTAVEQSANRLKRLDGNLQRLGFEAELVHSDLIAFQPDTLFDAVLLDAPCSSTGTTRRHPDVLYTKGMQDITKLASVQEKLLRHAMTLVVPGGSIVFSNCSLDPMEGEEVVAKVLADHPDFQRVPVQAEQWPGLEAAISPLGEFRTTPAMLQVADSVSSGLDGFYACHLRRI
ncbi:RsmB/NOP family class I SAM-dependent RNA methyltransferase [Allorhizobium terrae]|uniref:RsmB/NOP family class I SAM-dependent RNA methyltransferase n=1 Tax=Allorhizobium terrae TaxID=1848972 RepID=A0A4S3ZWJ9_9HYPH|nr:RsmB/NOP family class I SAM-dependent RNA methyltransferase [Allorhizobium terrae]THF50240.1 RsmB/NOP family class I SAM-dependent RNA methyltransferase [Allorhizobium terrae]